MRCLLVDNILNNLDLDVKNKNNDDTLKDCLSKVIVESGATDNLLEKMSNSAISLSETSTVDLKEESEQNKLYISNQFKMSTGE